MAVAPARLTSLDEVIADEPPTVPEMRRGARSTLAGDQGQLQLLAALRAVRRGNFDVRLPTGPDGVSTDIATAFNEIVEANQLMVRELRRVQRTVGRAGRIRERAAISPLAGGWSKMLGAVNELLDDLTAPTLEVSRVLDAVARGDLDQHLALELDGRQLRGEFRRSREVVNAMVDQLNAFA
jgi:HAMP domain-containing protein